MSHTIDWTTIADIVTNSNGTAIKFGNGLMLCYKTFTNGEILTDPTYGVKQWTFPVPFVDVPSAFACNTRGQDNYTFYTARVNSLTETNVQFMWSTITNQVAANTRLNVCPHYAIGRWK